MKKNMTFAATGDSFITRRLALKNESFNLLSSIIQSAEVRFTNLEVTAHHFEGFPSAVSGGTWAIVSPYALEDLKAYGFNLVAWANNHTLDYSYGGLEATEKYLNKYGFVHAGVGDCLAKANEPKYLETPSGRVALISVTATIHESGIAGEQRPDMKGRPGVNPLRFDTVYYITKERMKQLKDIAEISTINAVENLAIKEGFKVKPGDDVVSFGNYTFKEGSPEGQVTTPNQQDMKRISRTISEAKRQADYVLVSVHAHEMEGEDKRIPAKFIETFARKCIDDCADAVIGHGPHIIRGIEIYKNRPIFYSLGNFIFQNETVSHLPADFYEKYGLEHSNNVADALDARSNNNTKGLGVDPFVWTSIIPFWEMAGDELKEIKLYPIDLGFGQPRYRRGWPMITKNIEILEELRDLSEVYGTQIEIEDGIGKIPIHNHSINLL